MIHDIAETAKLIRPDDEVVYGDSGYLGIEKREEIASDAHLSRIDYRINRRPGKTYRKFSNNGQAWEKAIERQKSAVRSKVEHPFRFVKVQCGFRKTIYRGIQKNLNRLHILFASSNLYACARAGRTLRPQNGQQNQEKRRSEADTICRLLEEICQIQRVQTKNQS